MMKKLEINRSDPRKSSDGHNSYKNTEGLWYLNSEGNDKFKRAKLRLC